MYIEVSPGSATTEYNSGSCRPLAEYCFHELREHPELAGELHLPPDLLQFFDVDGMPTSKEDIIPSIDALHSHLRTNDTKFYSLIVSPSDKEIRAMGDSIQEQLISGKTYVLSVLDSYAKAFHRPGITSRKDIVAFAIPHLYKEDSSRPHLHWHVIVARKDRTNKIKLSPCTNHRNTQAGAIRGGFNRVLFAEKCETVFDRQFGYRRDEKETVRYLMDKKKKWSFYSGIPLSSYDHEGIRQAVARRKAAPYLRQQITQAQSIVNEAFETYRIAKEMKISLHKEITETYDRLRDAQNDYWDTIRRVNAVTRGTKRLIWQMYHTFPLLSIATSLIFSIALILIHSAANVKLEMLRSKIIQGQSLIGRLNLERAIAVLTGQDALSTAKIEKAKIEEMVKAIKKKSKQINEIESAQIDQRYSDHRLVYLPSRILLQVPDNNNNRWKTVREMLEIKEIPGDFDYKILYRIKDYKGAKRIITPTGREIKTESGSDLKRQLKLRLKY